MTARLFLFLFVLIISACSDPQSPSIRFGLASAPISLDPRFATDASSSRINRLLYQRLVDFDSEFKAQPSLADWEVISPTHYRFTLKKIKRQFQNGESLDSDDVLATYSFILDPSNASPHRGSLQLINKIAVINNDVIDFFLDKPDPLFPGYLTIGIVPASVMKNKLSINRASMGSGLFRFVDWPGAGNLVIERGDDNLKVEFIAVKDATVRALKLIRGEVDILQNDLPGELTNYLGHKSGINVTHHGGTNFTYLALNLRDPLLADLRVRRAIAHAVNRNEIIRYLLGEKTMPANALLTKNHWAGLKETNEYKYDPVLAKKLLKDAGYDADNPLMLEYKTTSDPLRIRIATVIQQQLKQAGIILKLRSFDWATVYGDIKAGRFQMSSLSWVGIKNPDIFRYVFHSGSVPPKGANRGGYENAHVDELIDKAATVQDLTERAELYRQIQEIILKELPYIPLWYESHVMVSSDHISGYQLANDGNYDGLLSIKKN